VVSCAPNSLLPIPEETGDGWQTASLESVDLDPPKIQEAVSKIEDGVFKNIHSIVIVKDDSLVFEIYFQGYAWDYDADQFKGELIDYGRDTIHNLASVTKSFTSALVGIAIDHGYIESIESAVFDFFPEYWDEQKEKITLEHLLTMTSGFEWNEMAVPYSDLSNDLVMLFQVPDPIGYILQKPNVAKPGDEWYYNGGNTNLLAEIIREATGLRMDEFAEEHLFSKLGITHYEWDFINPDMIHASGNLMLRPRDLAKFGYLFLNGGVWDEKRIVSEDWVRESTMESVSLSSSVGYGYQWWQTKYRSGDETFEAFHASGWGGQEIVVFPSLEMVVVFTGGNYVGVQPTETILTTYILPAVEHDG
jgi:CubicO group peptidase (beta-lactamase class C family)